MVRKREHPQKKSTRNLSLNASGSYISLILGALVVLFAAILIVNISKNKIYDKINTSVSTFQEQNSLNEPPNIYKVKSGETLWSISEKVYGSGYNWVDLAKANKLETPDLIFVGEKLIIPGVQKIAVQQRYEQVQNNGPSISTSSYTIAKGDYLWDIAFRRYGNGYKWPEIVRVNNIHNPDLIYVGNTLKLP